MALLSDDDVFGSPASTGLLSDDDVFGPAKKQKSGIVRGIADLGLGFVSGAVGATKAIADAAGAGNSVSSALNNANEGITSYLSDSAKADQREQSRIMQDAEGKGVWEGIKAGAKAFAVAPAQTAVSGLGSVVPMLAGSAATALTGGSAPVALAAGTGLGAAMGSGTVKGAIFDEVKKRGLESGMNEADATNAATKAQAYGGDNTGNIVLGAGLGMADAATGVTKAASNIVRNAIIKPVVSDAVKAAEHGIARRVATGIAGEMPLEAAQGGQERYAANVAAQRAGYDVDPWAGVASQATLESLASAGPGAAFGAFNGSKYAESKLAKQRKQAAEEQQRQSAMLAGNANQNALANIGAAESEEQDGYWPTVPPGNSSEGSGIANPPTTLLTPAQQMANEAAATADTEQSDLEAVYQARAAFEQHLRQSVTIINEPAPLQQRIDEMLNVDPETLHGLERTRYEKELAKALNEPIGIRHDENQREVPFTMGEYLDAQIAADDAARARPLKQNASQQAKSRLQQLADEEVASQPDIAPAGIASLPSIPVIGPLSAAANLAVQSGEHARAVARQSAGVASSRLGSVPASSSGVGTGIAGGISGGIAGIAPTAFGQQVSGGTPVATTAPAAPVRAAQSPAPADIHSGDGVTGLPPVEQRGIRSIGKWTAEELQARLDRGNLSPKSEQRMRAELAKRKPSDNAQNASPEAETQSVSLVEPVRDLSPESRQKLYLSLKERVISGGVSLQYGQRQLAAFDEAVEAQLAQDENQNTIKNEKPDAATVPDETNAANQEPIKKDAAVEAGIKQDSALEKRVLIAADSIDKLRKVDVERVLTQGNIDRQQMAEYIKRKRPELAGEVDDVMAELQPSVSEAAGGDLHSEIDKTVKSLEDERQKWIDKDYKDGKKVVRLKGDGPSNKETMTVGSINRRRRDSVINELARQIMALKKLKDISIDSLSSRLAKAVSRGESTQDFERRVKDSQGNIRTRTEDEMIEAEIWREFIDPNTSATAPATKALLSAYRSHVAGTKNKASPIALSEGQLVAETQDWLKELFGNEVSDDAGPVSQPKTDAAPEAKQEQAPAITPQHVENGEAETATAAVVEQSLKKGAANSPLDLRQERTLLLKKIDAAIVEAPTAEEKDAWDRINQKIDLTNNMHVAETIGYKVFDVPGDGKFKVLNLKESLQRFRENVQASPGFKSVPQHREQKVAPWQRMTSGGTEATIRELLDGKEYQAAYEYSKQIDKPMVFGAAFNGEVLPYTDARPFEAEGFDDFKMVSARSYNIGSKTDTWAVIELSSGIAVVTGQPTRAKAEAKARVDLEKMGIEKVAEHVAKALAQDPTTARHEVSDDRGGKHWVQEQVGMSQGKLADKWLAWAEGIETRAAEHRADQSKQEKADAELWETKPKAEPRAKTKAQKPPKIETVGDMTKALNKIGYDHGTLPMNSREIRVGLNMKSPFSDQKFEAVINLRGGQWQVSEVEVPELKSEGMVDAMKEFRANLESLNNGKWPGGQQAETTVETKANASAEQKHFEKGTALYNIASPGTMSPADKAIYGMAAEGKSAEEMLKFIASASRNPFYRQVAKLLLKTGIVPKVMAGTSDGWRFNAGNDKKYAAAYNEKTDTIALFRPAAAERNFVHEAIHAATLRALGRKGLAAGQMKALFAHVKKSGAMNGMYGMSDIDEFVAEAFTNPKFQEKLKAVSAPTGSGKLSSAWHWFVRIVRGILGIPQGQENALSQALEIGLGVMREDMKLRSADSWVPFSEITGMEINKALGGTLQEKATNWMRTNLQGKSFKNDMTGWDISVGRKGINKTMMHASKSVHARSVAAIPSLLKHAVLVASEENRNAEERKSVPLVHHLYAPLRIAGADYVARLVVKEAKDGTRFYDYETSNEISPAVPGEFLPFTQRMGNSPSARPNMSMAKLLSHVKKEHGGTDPKFIRYNVADDGWAAPDESKIDSLIYEFQDKQIDLRRVVEAIKAKVGQIKDAFNPYLQEELYHARRAERIRDFLDREERPLIGEIRMRGLTIEEVESFLWARTAKETNAHIASINQGIQDGGSGLTNREADDYFAGLDVKDAEGNVRISGMDAAKRDALEAIAKRVDAIVEGNRKLMVDYQLESQAKVDGWKKTFPNYVPMMRDHADDPLAGSGVGQGFSVRGKEAKHRTGSKRDVVDILGNLMLQRERIITRGEKNRVSQALVMLADENPNKGFWRVDVPETEQVLIDGKVVTRVNPMWKSRPEVVIAKFLQNGKVVERAVIFNRELPRALRLAEAMKNLDAEPWIAYVGAATRYMSAINTQYNPVFGVVNVVRDVQTGMLNLSSTPLKGKQREVAGNLFAAAQGIYAAMRGDMSGEWAKLYDEFRKAGGVTGYTDMHRTGKEYAEELQNMLDPKGWFKVAKSIKESRIATLLDHYNTLLENMTRLATYKTALDHGLSQDQAASLAKNLTVNFNRKGRRGAQIGSLYAFFNAAIQGSARMAQTMMKDGKLSETGMKIMAGGVLLGVVQAALLAAAGFDDEEPPQFVRERALIVPLFDGKKYLSIPMPLGFHVVPNIGRIGAEFAMGGFRDAPKRMAQMTGLVVDAFNPIGSGTALQTISPTVVDPLAALSENKDFTGRNIAKRDFKGNTPGHLLSKDTATPWAKGLSYAFNVATGGTDFKKGLFSPTPDQIDYLIGQFTGGVGREAGKVAQTVTSVATGEELPTHKIPLVGRFYGDGENSSAEQNRFYGNLNRLKDHAAELKGLREERRFDEAAEYLRDNPEAALATAADRLDRDLGEMRKQKRQAVEADEAGRVKMIEARMRFRMKEFNDRLQERMKMAA